MPIWIFERYRSLSQIMIGPISVSTGSLVRPQSAAMPSAIIILTNSIVVVVVVVVVNDNDNDNDININFQVITIHDHQ